MDTSETGGRDRIDAGLRGAAAPVRLRAIDFVLRTRSALGLQPLAAPALVFVPLGFLLGPSGAGLLNETVVARLAPVVTVALAALGIFIGMALGLRATADRRLLLAASAQAMTTFGAVAGATTFLIGRWGLGLDTATALVTTALGVAASVSAAGAPDHPGDAVHGTATRIADLDDAFAVVVGAVVVAAVHHPSAVAIGQALGQASIVAVLAGFAGWLLFERAHSEAERGVFVLGTIALVGGAADYLRCSPLFAGMVAGLMWRVLPGRADRIVREDVSRYQHPLVLLLLITAGALVTFTPTALWLLGPFVVFRLAGKVVGAWIGARLVPGVGTADLAAYLLPPGLIGIALALNFYQVSASPAAGAIVTAVAAGTLASEVLALVALPGRSDG